MKIEEKALIKAKKVECCIGFFFFIPAVLGALAFIFAMLGFDTDFAKLKTLSYRWMADYGENGGGMSAAPIYMGIMASVGAYLIKDNLKYFFIKEEKEKDSTIVQADKKID